MSMQLSRIVPALLLAFVVLLSGAADATAQNNKTLVVNKASIPVVMQVDGVRKTVRYSQLDATQQGHFDYVISSLNAVDRDLPPLPRGLLKMSAPNRDTASLGCGFNSTGSEPLQFGCWLNGDVCYIFVGGDDIVGGGCHQCNGTNCPKD
ncbi:MAG TPA: hypothetical protein EYH07_11600 [Kiloniellaceae bacterium]|nr:hypothetical protein [Kiloniellaceae bacterium]HIP79094.1 hypothetical protein [Kiloniellaceae bacterium]